MSGFLTTEDTEGATPETDAAWQSDKDTIFRVMTSRRLERERDEARNKMADALQELDLRTLDFERMKQERDEAIADRDIARLSALDSDRAHDRMVGELEGVYRQLDEARDTYKDWIAMGRISDGALAEMEARP